MEVESTTSIIEDEPGRSRRQVLAAGMGGLLAAVAAALGRPAPVSAAHGDVHLGATNTAATNTIVNNTSGAVSARGFTGSIAAPTPGTDSSGLLGMNKGANASTQGVSGYHGGAGRGVLGNSVGGHGVFGQTSANNRHGVVGLSPHRGVLGKSTGSGVDTAGVWGAAAAPTGIGVLGEATNTTGQNAGVSGTAAGASGMGVQGNATHPTGYGYGGYFTGAGSSSTGIYASGGFYGSLNYAAAPGSTAVYASGVGRGIDAYSEAATGIAYGVFGDADSNSGGHGVHGRADASTGVNYGIRGEVYSADGFGGHFRNVATGNNGIGVEALASGASATAVPGGYYAAGVEGSGGNGLIGAADRSSGYGVVGIQGVGAYAGYFNGDVNITGATLAPRLSSRIDHPLDPANRYLTHSAIASPDMKNVYDGVVQLNASGGATVKLPAYFGALNRDFRYQLTAIGGAAPNLHIAQGVAGNQFTIAGGGAGMQVSWQVTGIRKDAFANANLMQVETDKPAGERGKYLNPELHGGKATDAIGLQGDPGRARSQPGPSPRPSDRALAERSSPQRGE